MMRLGKKIIMGLFLLSFIASTSSTLAKTNYTKAQELVDRSVIVLKRFLADPQMEWFRQHIKEAKGVMIIPQLIKGGFFIGGSGGSGVLLVRDPKYGWSYPAFYLIGSVSFGLQLGGEVSEIVLLVTTQKGIDALLSTAVKLGGDVSVAAGPVGMGAKAQIADILAFGRSKGAFAGVSIEGAVIKPKDSWNKAYYGRPVRPVEILVLHKVSNPRADKLRRLLSQFK